MDARLGGAVERLLGRHARINASTASRFRSMSSARDERLEVEAQKRLGVGGADVEVPLGVVDRDPVEPGDLAIGVALGELAHLRLLIRHLGVDLSRDEVALPEGADQLGEATPLDGQQLQDQERRDRPRVSAPEVVEVVVARHLAPEGGRVLAHPELEEGVPDPVDVRGAAQLAHRVRDRPAGPHVVEDRGARLLSQNLLREQRGQEVAVHELAPVVDEEAAIGVAVPRDAEVGALDPHLLHDEPAVLLHQRIRLVVGELAVRNPVCGDQIEPKPLQDRADHRAGHPVAAVHDDLQRAHQLRFDEGEHVALELVVDVHRLHSAAARWIRHPRLDLGLHLADPGVA